MMTPPSRYSIGSDPAGWLAIDPDHGIVTVKEPLDRESVFVQDSTYTAIVLAADDGESWAVEAEHWARIPLPASACEKPLCSPGSTQMPAPHVRDTCAVAGSLRAVMRFILGL